MDHKPDIAPCSEAQRYPLPWLIHCKKANLSCLPSTIGCLRRLMSSSSDRRNVECFEGIDGDDHAWWSDGVEWKQKIGVHILRLAKALTPEPTERAFSCFFSAQYSFGSIDLRTKSQKKPILRVSALYATCDFLAKACLHRSRTVLVFAPALNSELCPEGRNPWVIKTLSKTTLQ